MEERDWSQLARAIRKEKQAVAKDIMDGMDTETNRIVVELLIRAENIAMTMAGGYVY